MFEDLLDDRRAGGSIDRIYHFPVLLSNTKTTDRTLTGIIVYRNISIFQKDTGVALYYGSSHYRGEGILATFVKQYY